MVWEREANDSLIKKAITRGVNNVIPNYIAGGMDATEGAYVWNYSREGRMKSNQGQTEEEK